MSEEAKARESALRFLAGRDHSSAEIGRKLIRKGFTPQAVASVTTYLQEKGYLDDRRFAERWAAAAVESGRCYGPRLRAELKQRGIDPATVSGVIDDLSSGADEAQAVELLMRRKFPDFSPSGTDEKEKRRIFGFLQRRGFSSSAIFSVFRDFDI